MDIPMQLIDAIPTDKDAFDKTIQDIREAFCQSLTPDQQSLINSLPYPESQIYRRMNATCPVLWVAPHGFFGDALHTDYLGIIAAEMMAGSCLVNNKKFRRPLPQSGYGEIANLNDPEDLGSQTRSFIKKLISAISIIRLKSNQVPYIVFLLNLYNENKQLKITVATSDEQHDCPSSKWISRLKQSFSTDQYDISFLEKKQPEYDRTLFSNLFQKQPELGHLRLIQIQLNCVEILKPDSIVSVSNFLSKALSYATQVEMLPQKMTHQDSSIAPVEKEADMRLVEKAGMKLTQIISKHYENAMIEAGNYLVQMFFDNDIERARKKKPAKEKSLYQLILYLQRQKNNAPSKSWIYNAVNLAVDYSDYKHFHTYGKLLLSHKILLLPIDKKELKKNLIQEVANNQLTVSQLKNRIDELKNDPSLTEQLIEISKNTKKKKIISKKNSPRLVKKSEKSGELLSQKILEAVDEPPKLFRPEVRQYFNQESLTEIKSVKRRQILRKLQKKHTGILSDIKQLKSLIQEHENYLQHYQSLMVEMENTFK